MAPFKTPHPVWQTEWADLDGGWRIEWANEGHVGEGLEWANKIQDAVTRSNCSAFLYWIGAELASTNSALIKINHTEVEVSKRLWAFAHFGRYVRPGAERLDVDVTNKVQHVSAYENKDGEVSVVVINNAHYDTRTTIKVGGGAGEHGGHGGPHGGPGGYGKPKKQGKYGKVTTWLTNNEHDISKGKARLRKDGSFEVEIPKRSMMTFVLS
jgi:O-glycosyl hydrolase